VTNAQIQKEITFKTDIYYSYLQYEVFLKYAGELHIIALRRKVHRPHQFKLKTYAQQKKSKKTDDKAMRRSQPWSACQPFGPEQDPQL
jgi:hypothetical protein